MGQDAEDPPTGTAASHERVAQPPNLTRRVLLSSAAATGAATLLTPATGLASAGSARRSVWSLGIGALSGESAPIIASRGFSLAGVQWSAPEGARIELRSQAPNGRWGPWAVASVRGHDGDGQRPATPLYGEPIWTGPADRLQVRSDSRVEGVRLHFVTPSDGIGAAALASTAPLAQPILAAGPGQPPILARSGWAGRRRAPRHPPQYGSVKLAFVHHTETPNGYGALQVPAILRSIFDYHVFVRGFWDIAYNFLIDAHGRIWEGRAGGIDMAVMGAQAGAYNLESTGVAVIGSFMNVAPSSAAIAALQRLLAWKLSLHGIPTHGRVTVVVDPADAFYTPFAPGAHVSLPRVAGHRDGDSTSCPGDAFYHRLPSIRPRITAMAGTPATITIAAPAAPAPAGSTVAVSGKLSLLTGAPLAGAPIEFQQLGPFGPPASTIATTTTAADGSWSASVASEQNVLVRALHPVYPATAADWALVAFSPVLTLALQSSSPLVVSGTIAPGKRRVTIALYPSTRTTGKPLARRRVSGLQGSFAAQLPVPGPGTYLVLARTAGDPRNAPASSAPLSVTVA